VFLKSLTLYDGRHFHSNNKTPCQPAGRPMISFPNTVGRIYTYAQYGVWRGTHTDEYRWYAPGGKLIFDDKGTPYTGHGVESGCDYQTIARTRVQNMIGRWTVQLIIDGRPLGSTAFTLTRR
jgi:hypothetical protein